MAPDPTVKPRIGPRTERYRDRNQSIYEVTADFGEFSKTYFVDDHDRRVGVVVPKGGDILLVEQYRLLTDDLSLEIPGGRIDDGETSEQAAIRECREETNVSISGLRHVVNYLPGMDAMNNPTDVFIAGTIDDIGPFVPDAREVRARNWVPLETCLEMIFTGKIRCALTIVGIFGFALSQQQEA